MVFTGVSWSIYIYIYAKGPNTARVHRLACLLGNDNLVFHLVLLYGGLPLPGELAVEHRNSRPQGTVNDNGNHFKVGLGSEQCTTTQTPW